MALDPQIVELLGRQRLIGALLRDGLEVVVPARDRPALRGGGQRRGGDGLDQDAVVAPGTVFSGPG